MMRAVLDVNVIISAIIAPKGTPRQVLEAWRDQRFDLVISEGMIAQVEEKLRLPKIGGAYNVSEADIRWVRALFRTQAEVVLVRFEDLVGAVKDPEDDYVLATGVVGKADYLVTGDRGLLALKEHRKVRIVNPRAFLETLNRRAPHRG